VSELDATLDRLDAVLTEERAAILGMDAERVVRAADDKCALVAALAAEPAADRRRASARLAELAKRLRHNGTLLAHARDCLRDALLAANGEPPLAPDAPPRPRACLSVMG
jgi:hypothetical protein